MIDDRTTHLNLPKPNTANTQVDDVWRLRDSLDVLDSLVHGKQASLGFTPENAALRGQPSGFCPLDSGSKVPSAFLPGYVDEILEYASAAAFPGSGESGKIYLALDTNAQYRWSGSTYIKITQSPGTSDDILEGAANLYFTPVRARSAQLPATGTTLGVVKIGSGIGVSVDGEIFLDMESSFSETLVPVAVNGQTSFVVDGGYIAGSMQVLVNGVELLRNVGYEIGRAHV